MGLSQSQTKKKHNRYNDRSHGSSKNYSKRNNTANYAVNYEVVNNLFDGKNPITQDPLSDVSDTLKFNELTENSFVNDENNNYEINNLDVNNDNHSVNLEGGNQVNNNNNVTRDINKEIDDASKFKDYIIQKLLNKNNIPNNMNTENNHKYPMNNDSYQTGGNLNHYNQTGGYLKNDIMMVNELGDTPISEFIFNKKMLKGGYNDQNDQNDESDESDDSNESNESNESNDSNDSNERNKSNDDDEDEDNETSEKYFKTADNFDSSDDTKSNDKDASDDNDSDQENNNDSEDMNENSYSDPAKVNFESIDSDSSTVGKINQFSATSESAAYPRLIPFYDSEASAFENKNNYRKPMTKRRY